MQVYKNGRFEVVKGNASYDTSEIRYYVKVIGRKGFLTVHKYESAAKQVCNMYAMNTKGRISDEWHKGEFTPAK